MTFSITNTSQLFKTKYGPLADATYNSANVLLGRIKKDYNFVGNQMQISNPLSFSGGVGASSLPTANFADYGLATLTAKKVYSVMAYDRESIKASSTLEGAFTRGIDEVTKKGVEAWMRFASYILFSDGSGVLGQAGVVTGSGPWTVPIRTTTATLAADSFKEANFEENDYVNIFISATRTLGALTGGTNKGTFEITAVNPATPSITVAAVGSVTAPVDGDFIVMQNSRNACPQGLLGALDATTSTLYGVNVARRWQAYQFAAASAPLSVDLMNNAMLEVQRRCGKVPTMIITSFKQFARLLNILEDQKQYVIEPRMPELRGKVSFKGIEFMSAAGAVAVFPERFCNDDRMYFINDNMVTAFHRPDFGFFDDDGTVFLRSSSADSYEARYGGYFENYIVPTFHGVITGLA
jgi:hypothetical protein